MLVHDRATPLARTRTPEGFLKMRARIGRAGLHDYKAGEIGGPPGAVADAPVRVWRPPDEVFDPASLASFAGKPVTLDHPPAMIDSTNWKRFAVGHSGGAVTRDGDHLAADLVITDATAVAKAEAGSELSNGYWADFDFAPGLTPDGEPYDAVQRNIRGNHVALVDQGRCGPSCAAVASDTVSAGDAAPRGDPSAEVRDCPPDPALVGRLRATIEARDGEIAGLKAHAAADAAALDIRVAERAATLDAARRLIGADLDAEGQSLSVVRRTAVAKVLGPEAIRDRTDDYVAAAFDALAALRPPRADTLSRHLAAATPTPAGDAARQDRDAFLNGAWRPALGDQ